MPKQARPLSLQHFVAFLAIFYPQKTEWQIVSYGELLCWCIVISKKSVCKKSFDFKIRRIVLLGVHAVGGEEVFSETSIFFLGCTFVELFRSKNKCKCINSRELNFGKE